MKLNLFFFMILISITMLSCKKKYSCICTYSETGLADKKITFTKIDNKQNANDWCRNYDTIYTINGSTISYICKIDE